MNTQCRSGHNTESCGQRFAEGQRGRGGWGRKRERGERVGGRRRSDTVAACPIPLFNRISPSSSQCVATVTSGAHTTTAPTPNPELHPRGSGRDSNAPPSRPVGFFYHARVFHYHPTPNPVLSSARYSYRSQGACGALPVALPLAPTQPSPEPRLCWGVLGRVDSGTIHWHRPLVFS